MSAPLVRPVYVSTAESTSFPANSNYFYTATQTAVTTTYGILATLFLDNTGATVTTALPDPAGSPNLSSRVYVGGAVQEPTLFSLSTAALTLNFSSAVTIYPNEVVQIGYDGATVSTTTTLL